MARSGFRLNRAGVTQLLNGPQARAVIDQASQTIVEGAQAAVHSVTGHARRSYKVAPAQQGPDGAQGAAYSDDEAGAIIEFGSEDTEPQRPLTRGAQGSGLRFREQAK